MNRTRFFLILALLLLFPLPVMAMQSLNKLSKAQTGDIFFTSHYRASPTELMTGKMPRDKVAIHGVLTMPDLKGGKVPAMVILHTSLGIQPHVHEAAKGLNKAGIAAFVIDSHTTRGGKFTVEEARNLVPSRVADAYAALKLLASHPLIDKSRIGVMGYSSGGTVALFTTSRKMQQALAGGGLRFAAHVAYYPHCWRQLEKPEATGAPVLMLLAREDNLTPIVQCQDFGKRIEASGAPVQAISYPGAYHAFDFPMLAGKVIESKRLPDVSKCLEHIYLVRPDGRWFAPSLNRHGAHPAVFGDMTKDCRSGNARLGGPPGVAKKAFQATLTFLRKTFNLPKQS